jgi:nucleoside-diphosphate-sugar epimerase
VVWGSGWQARDFIHVDDVVGATLARIRAGVEGYDSMNIGSGSPTAFNAVARMMADIVGYEPEIANDDDKPEGVQSRYCDPSKMLQYYVPSTTLERGFRRVVEAVEA